MSPGPEAAAEPEQQTTIASVVGAGTPLPGAGAADLGDHAAGAGATAGSPSHVADGPPPFVAESPASLEDPFASAPGWLDRQPEIAVLAGGFTGGLLLAAILRRLGR